MLSRIFSYTVTSASSLIRNITIAGGKIITIYNGKSNAEPYPTEFRMLSEITQGNSKCAGKPFDFIRANRREHAILNPHSSFHEIHHQHWHLGACDLLTPDDLNYLLRNILRLQSDKHQLTAFMAQNKEQVELMYGKYGKDIVNVKIDSIEFLSRADARLFKQTYAKFYSDNEVKLRDQYLENQQLISWQAQVFEYGEIACESAKMAAITEVLCEALRRAGANKDLVNHAMNSLILAYLVINSDSWTPVIKATMFNFLFITKPELSSSRYASAAKLAISMGVYVIGSEEYSLSNYMLKLGTGTISAFLTGACVRHAANYFFPVAPPEQVAAHSECTIQNLSV